MFESNRIIYSLLYLGTTVGTLLMALLLDESLRGLVYIMIILEMISYFLYTISYIPFGTRILTGVFRFAFRW